MAKLLLDEMLKRTAKWCRIFGIDTEFITGKSDSQLLAHARKEKLVLVTRDMELLLRCRRQGVRCIFLRSELLEEQLAQIVREAPAELTFPQQTRCPDCNGELKVVGADKVRGKVPENIATRYPSFWECAGCGKAYWEGSHWQNITRIFNKVKELLRC